MLNRCGTRATAVVLAAVVAAASQLAAQVDVYPRSIEPLEWERITVRVVNNTSMPTVGVRVLVPEVVGILGVEDKVGWDYHVLRASDTAPQSIEWRGGAIRNGDFAEFTFLGRVSGDVRRKSLVVPVTITRADGSTVSFGGAGSDRAAPTIQIAGSTRVTVWGSLALAGVAVGIAILALALAVSNRGARDNRGDRA